MTELLINMCDHFNVQQHTLRADGSIRKVHFSFQWNCQPMQHWQLWHRFSFQLNFDYRVRINWIKGSRVAGNLLPNGDRFALSACGELCGHWHVSNTILPILSSDSFQLDFPVSALVSHPRAPQVSQQDSPPAAQIGQKCSVCPWVLPWPRAHSWNSSGQWTHVTTQFVCTALCMFGMFVFARRKGKTATNLKINLQASSAMASLADCACLVLILSVGTACQQDKQLGGNGKLSFQGHRNVINKTYIEHTNRLTKHFPRKVIRK